jgi:hypothetical protein
MLPLWTVWRVLPQAFSDWQKDFAWIDEMGRIGRVHHITAPKHSVFYELKVFNNLLFL